VPGEHTFVRHSLTYSAHRWGFLAVAHEDADHVVALGGEQMGRDAGIDSATHGQDDARHIASLWLMGGCGKDGLVVTPATAYNSPRRSGFPA
jgi:hypothetical protein